MLDITSKLIKNQYNNVQLLLRDEKYKQVHKSKYNLGLHVC